MSPADSRVARQVAQIVIRGVGSGTAVEIDGLGIFHPDPLLGFRFEPSTLAQVFLAYGKEDHETVCRLYAALEAAGFAPWMDTRKLLPGQNWPRAIESAIETSDFFVACFSGNSVSRKGGFQAEIRYALDCARQVPLDEIFLVPVRLDACALPRTIEKQYQYVDLFPDWESGIVRITQALRRELQRRRGSR